MKKKLIVPLVIVVAFGFGSAFAQFPISIPKLPKVDKSKEQPAPPSSTQQSDRTQGDGSTPGQPPHKQSKSGSSQTVQKPLPNNVPVFLKDTIGIDAKTENNYWKFPNQNNFSSWIPQISFDVFYDESSKLRYVAEWFNPDGSPWFSEPLEMYQGDSHRQGGITLRSADSDELFKTKATNSVGTYSVKISNSKTNETIFQGKFKVGKLAHPDEPKEKNLFRFYVDNDWLIPVGYNGYDIQNWNNIGLNYPAVMMWFKGNLEYKEFEAVLYQNGKQIASTDKGGNISTIQERGGNCYQIREFCAFRLWRFSWNNFMLGDKNRSRENLPNNTLFTGELPGEFTVKISYKGEQVREAKFSLAPDGAPIRNSLSDQIYSTMGLMPVKATGTAEKWNANAWKTDMFYGNPLSGFTIQ
ncbi:MAG: hypothetical protein ABJB40_02305 [Acidobacteriota bacterium]